MNRSRAAGFTLIELLIVVVILGILASIAIPTYQSTKGKAFGASMKSDLRNLATAEEVYYYDNAAYTTDQSLMGYAPTPGVTIDIPEATSAGWSATATSPQADPSKCAIFVGSAAPVAPATVESELRCN